MKIKKIADYCSGDYGQPTGHLDSQIFPCKKDPSQQSRKRRKKKIKNAFNLYEYKTAEIITGPDMSKLRGEDKEIITGPDMSKLREDPKEVITGPDMSKLRAEDNILVNGDNKPIKLDFNSIKNEIEKGNGTVYTTDALHRFSISMEEDRQSVSIVDDKVMASIELEYPAQIDVAVKKFIFLVNKLLGTS